MNERTCPVCNEEIEGEGVTVDAGDREVTVCCNECARKLQESPASYVAAEE